MYFLSSPLGKLLININMRCIEIEVAGKNNLADVRLTLT